MGFARWRRILMLFSLSPLVSVPKHQTDLMRYEKRGHEKLLQKKKKKNKNLSVAVDFKLYASPLMYTVNTTHINGVRNKLAFPNWRIIMTNYVKKIKPMLQHHKIYFRLLVRSSIKANSTLWFVHSQKPTQIFVIE